MCNNENKKGMCHRNNRNIISIVLIAILGLVVYTNALGNSFVWDDDFLIVKNCYIKSWRHLPRIFCLDLFYGTVEGWNYYRPIQTLSYMVDYSIWHLRPFGYHISSLLFHILNACLVYLLVNLLSRDRRISLITGSLFVVHPVHTAAVAYISGRADLLVTFFFLISIWLFIKHTNYLHTKRTLCYIGSLFSFILALLSKEIALIFPLIVVLYGCTFMDRTPHLRLRDRIVKRYLAYFIIAGIYIFLRATVLNFAEELTPLSQTPIHLRLLTMCRVVFTYLRLLFFPIGLHMEWDVQPATSFFNLPVIASLLVLIFIWIAIAKSYRYSRTISFASLWFFICLIPVSNLVPLMTYLAEHWLYLPSMGFLMVLAVGIVRALEPKSAKVYSSLIKWAVAASLILALFFYSRATVRRNTDWADELTIFEHTLRYSPNNCRVLINLGIAYEERGLLDEAMSRFEEVIRLRPDYAEAYLNRGVIYGLKEMYDEANEDFREALRQKPHLAEAHHNLAHIHEKKGELGEAIREYKVALRLKPIMLKTHYDLAALYEKKGLFDEAITQYREVLRLDPNLPSLRQKLQKLKELGY